jgi:hypothetical protein
LQYTRTNIKHKYNVFHCHKHLRAMSYDKLFHCTSLCKCIQTKTRKVHKRFMNRQGVSSNSTSLRGLWSPQSLLLTSVTQLVSPLMPWACFTSFYFCHQNFVPSTQLSCHPFTMFTQFRINPFKETTVLVNL